MNSDEMKDYAERHNMTPERALAYLLGSDAEGELDRWRRAIQDNDWREAAPYVNSLIKQLGLNLSKDLPAYGLLCQGITLASGELQGIRISRSEGDWSEDPAVAPLRFANRPGARAIDSHAPSMSGDPLSASIAAFIEEKNRLGGTDKKRMMDYEAALRLFEGWCGSGTLLGAINKRKIGEFRSLLAKLPPNHTKRFRGRPLVEIIGIADAEGLTPLNPMTANSKYLALVETFFDWCQSGGRIDENPAKGVRIKPPKSGAGALKRGTFTVDHLRSMFGAPLFVGCEDKDHIYRTGTVQVRDHRFWLPLLGLWTGARLNELCQLGVEDVREVEGILCLDINKNGGKRLKSKAAKRLIPVHPALVQLGFRTYAEECRVKGVRLLPGINASSSGYDSDNVSKWFSRFLKFTIGDAEKRTCKLAFHSFRHTMEDAMRVAGIEARIQDALIGHDTDHVSARYGEGYKPPRLYEEMKKVQFPGLDLSHLHPPESGRAVLPRSSA